MKFAIRSIQAEDLPAILSLQDSCYSDELYESPVLLQQRLASHPGSCWLAGQDDGTLLAYLFSYPSVIGAVTPLAAVFNRYSSPELLYLHDMAVSHQARGSGLASALLRHAEHYAVAQKLNAIALVAVQGSAPYWQKQGFQQYSKLSADATQALASYTGQHAMYMHKDL